MSVVTVAVIIVACALAAGIAWLCGRAGLGLPVTLGLSLLGYSLVMASGASVLAL